MLLVHRRDVVEPVEIGDRLQVGFVFDELLGGAMEQTEMRVDALDQLAVELQDHAQHAVCRRVLGSEIDGEVAVLRRALHLQRRCARFHDATALPLQRYRFLHTYQPFRAASAFSSPGSGYSPPSHGLRKSKLLNSCGSLTG